MQRFDGRAQLDSSEATHAFAPVLLPGGLLLDVHDTLPSLTRLRATCCCVLQAEYEQALVAHHSLLTSAMKTKQVVDEAACDALDSAIAEVGKMYTK